MNRKMKFCVISSIVIFLIIIGLFITYDAFSSRNREKINEIEKTFQKEIKLLKDVACNYSYYANQPKLYQQQLKEIRETFAKQPYLFFHYGVNPLGKSKIYTIHNSKLKSYKSNFLVKRDFNIPRIAEGTGNLYNGEQVKLLYYYKDFQDNKNERRRVFLILPITSLGDGLIIRKNFCNF